MVIEEKITELLEEKFKEEEFADCFLIEIKLHKHNKLDIFLDSDSGITFQKCQRISRYLESYLDEEGWLGEKYVLEVSSPGLTRPLKLKRQYKKNIGRKVEVNLHEGKPIAGQLVEVNEEAIVLEKEMTIKEGKKKRKEMVQIPIPFENIKKTVVTISF
ncbi:MAG: ribosome assembly cofactor RimP [Saprospiraceae bacterium]|nr:ribosome assembly cofactor RimP [Saprospiraceae bacterium]